MVVFVPKRLYLHDLVPFGQNWLYLNKSGSKFSTKVLCFAKIVVFVPKRLYLENLVLFAPNWLYLNKSGSNFRVKCCVLPKL